MLAGPDRLCKEAMIAVAATAACRLLLLLLGKRRGRGFEYLRCDFSAACVAGLERLHGTSKQRHRAAYMCVFSLPPSLALSPRCHMCAWLQHDLSRLPG